MSGEVQNVSRRIESMRDMWMEAVPSDRVRLCTSVLAY